MQEFFPHVHKEIRDDIIKYCNTDLPDLPDPQNSDHLIDIVFQKFNTDIHDPEDLKKTIHRTKNIYQAYLDSTRVFISQENEFPGIRRLGFLGPSLTSEYAYNTLYFFLVRDDGVLHAGKLIRKKKDFKPEKNINQILNISFDKESDWNIEYEDVDYDYDVDNGAYIDNDIDIDYILDIIMSVVGRNKIKHVIKIVNDSLNPNIRDLVKRLNQTHNISFIRWLTGGDGTPPDIAQSRQQAVESYPLCYTDIRENKKIIHAIQNQKPLTPILAEIYKVDKKHLKRIQGKTLVDFRINDNDLLSEYECEDIVETVIDMDEDHFQQLKNNLVDLEIFENYADNLYNFSLREFLDYLSSRGGNLCQYIQKMKENSIHDVSDAFKFLCSKLFYPALLNKVKTHAEKNNLTFRSQYYTFSIAQEILTHNTNMNTIFDFSKRYHRNLHRWEDMFNHDSKIKHISWTPMFGKIDLGMGWSAREIHSIKALKEQGRKENHCVGGYAGSILEGAKKSARLIFSLEKDGIVKSTVDIKCSKNKEKTKLNAKINQNRAHSNQNPCRETLGFSDLLVKKIKNEDPSKIDTYLHNLYDVRKEYKKCENENEYLLQCGYNPWNREILQNVWDEFKPTLPAKLRRAGLDEFIDMMPLDDIDFQPRRKKSRANPWDLMENEEPTQTYLDETGIEVVM